ncbi:hypothetical protein Q9L42_005370 [Methylomarinum sp. Ch1-1]|uniref:Uracil DNA glycosylase superfamily protein n=1 Tax=Methylomarinum roseum TaxID=3067653 RepID=A0AAU7NX07_9GAMM|nr:hypothetical protein [Methylomarinum sp. Ch1-1]MDP4522370.1 hypothetical protein [Methylomarinum sp. Ch1-1]
MDNKEISEISCIDELMAAWKEAFPEGWHFNHDGVISKENWDISGKRVLFVLKETNKAKQNVVTAINRAIDVKKSGWWKGKVLRRVGRWAYGIQNYDGVVPPLKDAKLNEKNAIKNIAYINIRKTSGSATTNKKAFDTHASEFAPFVRRQVELIKPDVVVLCGTYSQVKRYIFPEIKKVSERVHVHEGVVFINAFHPAARKKSAILYHQVLDNYHAYKNL